MKETNKLKKANIENLISLWKTVSMPFDSYYKTSEFEYCEINGSEWPNKLWLNQELTQETINLVKIKLATLPTNMSLAIWGINNKNALKILEQNGFKVKFEQVGMALKPAGLFATKKDLSIELVTTNFNAKIWSDLFKKSFGYTISSETVIKTVDTIDYYIAYHNNKPIGTAIIHKTENVMGVHSVGIPPEMRRRGYAEQIMKLLINLSNESGNKFITLQASDMGKNLYLKLGFEEQFMMKNYVLQQPI